MKRTLLFSLFTVLLGSGLRLGLDRDLHFRVKQKIFLQQKIALLPEAQVLFLGDSRVMNGVDPTHWRGEGLNFAFTSNSFTENYLNYVLKHKSKNLEKVYIGLSVQALTDFYFDQAFVEAQQNQRHPWLLYLEHLYLKPIDLWNIKNHFKKAPRYSFIRGHMSLGESVGPASAIESYRPNYRDHQFNIRYIENLKQFAKSLESEGVRVIYFLTPSQANKDDFDPAISGISKGQLLEYFQQVYEFPNPQVLEYVDGDHLTQSSIATFSKWLSEL